MIKSEKFLTCKNIIISAKLMKKMTRKRQKISLKCLQYFATLCNDLYNRYIISDASNILVARNTWDRNRAKCNARYDLWRLCEVITILRLDMQLHGQRYLAWYMYRLATARTTTWVNSGRNHTLRAYMCCI